MSIRENLTHQQEELLLHMGLSNKKLERLTKDQIDLLINAIRIKYTEITYALPGPLDCPGYDKVGNPKWWKWM